MDEMDAQGTRRVSRAVRHRVLPGLIGWFDDGLRPALVIEDLSYAQWPPPWTRRQVEAVRACLAGVAAAGLPLGLPAAASSQVDLNGWPGIREDPEPLPLTGFVLRRLARRGARHPR